MFFFKCASLSLSLVRAHARYCIKKVNKGIIGKELSSHRNMVLTGLFSCCRE